MLVAQRTMSSRFVWVCGQYMKSEGGSVDGVFSSKSVAYAWLLAQRAEAVSESEAMNAFEWRDPTRPWVVSAIDDSEESMRFEDNLCLYIAKRTRVHDSYPVQPASPRA